VVTPAAEGSRLSVTAHAGVTALRVLDPRDRPAAEKVLDVNPVANVFVSSRVQSAGLDPWRMGGELWGWSVDGDLRALCYTGANLVPLSAGPDALRAFAERANRQGRRCSSLVGEADQVLGLWELLEPSWGAAREVRASQPLMATGAEPLVAPDPQVRVVRPDELEVVLPACVDMFTEEVGVSPLAGDGGAAYRARVAELVASGRAYARIEHGRVVFKAEVGAVTDRACQVQGVWVDPDRRGEGLAAPGMAAVVRACLRDVAPVVSLYVNDFNEPALATYRRVGFSRVGTFATVLF
jgi:predicted GNAT family acetyltransferase